MKNAYIGTVRIARRIADFFRLLSALERSKSRNVLWFRSLFSIYDSADLVRLDMPWWTFSAIDAVEAHLARKQGAARVFEYGAGASTVWLAKRCREVVTIEHDAQFAELMRSTFSSFENIDARVCPPSDLVRDHVGARSNRKGFEGCSFDEYVSSIGSHQGLFDLIVIDGRARLSCLAAAKGRLAADGIILFDNSDRSEYRPGIAKSGFEERILRGLAPALPFPSQTSLLLPKG